MLYNMLNTALNAVLSIKPIPKCPEPHYTHPFVL